MLVATLLRQGPGSRCADLQLHQDGGEPLREVVVNVPREAIALLEDRLTPFFDPIVIDETAVMQGQRCLPRDGLDEHDAAPVAFRLATGDRCTPSSSRACGRRAAAA